MARRIERHLGMPPFNRALWGILVVDERGRERYSRNADRLFVPASNTKLVVTAAALASLPAEGRRVTSVYGTGPVVDGILDGDLVVFGRGDPSFSARCYGIDTLAIGACDSMWTHMDALAAQVAARGIHHITGAIVGDGSYFDAERVHPAWEQYDLNWWYAAPVSGLGFNDNSLDVTFAPGPTVGAPADVSFAPDLGTFVFENRSQTLAAGARRSIDFFRQPGTSLIWAEGGVAVGAAARTEYFAVADPNRFFADALRAALARQGVSIGGPTLSTHDPTRYRTCRGAPAIAEIEGRPLSDLVFPILNSSQNWFAEMLLKTLGKEIADTGSWRAGLEVERRFLIDSVGIDSAAFALSDGSGLSSGNLLSPRAIVQLLAYMQRHPVGTAFVDALPRAGQRGSLLDRFRGTPLDGRVVAKTGSIFHVNTLSGYVARPDGKTWIFSVMANNHAAPYADMLARIDSIVVEMGR
ncbi:MAG: D-alanyl-D-alanine carboxypeptidase/D-alanyl-D-alanine-endopeptidase [Gemmatimonadota bacterium]|nr:D-alanyl-D-alanine carboxypeptidase/D-alanyl-D-alanine-endopeptidase [Gemmatimonadota bacterium]